MNSDLGVDVQFRKVGAKTAHQHTRLTVKFRFQAAYRPIPPLGFRSCSVPFGLANHPRRWLILINSIYFNYCGHGLTAFLLRSQAVLKRASLFCLAALLALGCRDQQQVELSAVASVAGNQLAGSPQSAGLPTLASVNEIAANGHFLVWEGPTSVVTLHLLPFQTADQGSYVLAQFCASVVGFGTVTATDLRAGQGAESVGVFGFGGHLELVPVEGLSWNSVARIEHLRMLGGEAFLR